MVSNSSLSEYLSRMKCPSSQQTCQLPERAGKLSSINRESSTFLEVRGQATSWQGLSRASRKSVWTDFASQGGKLRLPRGKARTGLVRKVLVMLALGVRVAECERWELLTHLAGG